jgi:hypothetical protein
MSFSKYYIQFFIIILLSGAGFSPSMNVIYNVYEVENADDYYDRTHRHSFYYKGVFFVFYIDEDFNLFYNRYDENGLLSNDSILEPVWSFADFSLVQDENFVYLAYAIPEGMNFRVYFLRGEIVSNGISWFSPVKLEYGDRPFIDLHNGKPVIVYSDGNEKSFKWVISYDENGEQWSSPHNLISWGAIDKDFFPAVYSLGKYGLMFIYWNGVTDRVYSIRYFEDNYSSPVLLYNCFDYLMEYQYFYYCWDAVVDMKSEIYFLNPAGEVMKWSPDTNKWKVDKQLMSETKEIALGLSYAEETDELYLFSLFKENSEFGYCKRDSAGWSEFTKLTNITDFKISGNLNEHVRDGRTGIRWFEEDNGHMLIKFGIINLKEITQPDVTLGGNSQKIQKTTSNLIPFTLLVLVIGLAFILKNKFFHQH